MIEEDKLIYLDHLSKVSNVLSIFVLYSDYLDQGEVYNIMW
jgi:hypothetical protein